MKISQMLFSLERVGGLILRQLSERRTIKTVIFEPKMKIFKKLKVKELGQHMSDAKETKIRWVAFSSERVGGFKMDRTNR